MSDLAYLFVASVALFSAGLLVIFLAIFLSDAYCATWPEAHSCIRQPYKLEVE